MSMVRSECELTPLLLISFFIFFYKHSIPDAGFFSSSQMAVTLHFRGFLRFLLCSFLGIKKTLLQRISPLRQGFDFFWVFFYCSFLTFGCVGILPSGISKIVSKGSEKEQFFYSNSIVPGGLLVRS